MNMLQMLFTFLTIFGRALLFSTLKDYPFADYIPFRVDSAV